MPVKFETTGALTGTIQYRRTFMRDIKLLLLSMSFVTFLFINTFSEDLEVILPKNWKGYTDDTVKTYLATPITGCFNDSLRFPKANWKGLFV
jgi:hypothetical protein